MSERKKKKLKKEDEFRKVERFNTDRSVKFMMIDGSEITSVSGINDLSEFGIQFVSREFIKPNLILQVVIDTGNGELKLSGRVAWVERGSYWKRACNVGMAFTGTTEEDRARIRQLKKKGWWFGRR